MLKIKTLETLELPELAAYKTMRRPQAHRDQGIFVAEGEKTVRRLLESQLPVTNILLPEKWLDEYSSLLARRIDQGEEIDVFTAEKKLLEALTGFSFYQGVLALSRVPEPVIPRNMISGQYKPLTFVAVESVTNAGNMGMISRNCSALGADLLITGEGCCSPYLRGAVHASMGTVFRLPYFESDDLCGTLESLKSAGVRLIAAHPRKGSLPLQKSNLRGNVCVVFGSEGPGLSERVSLMCHELVEIPMVGGVDSINVANSTAIFLYEICRQRTEECS